MENIKDKNVVLDKVVDNLLDRSIERFSRKEKQAFINLKSSKKLLNTVVYCIDKYTLPATIESCSELELEFIHHFFEALCEAIEDFQKEIVPIKE